MKIRNERNILLTMIRVKIFVVKVVLNKMAVRGI